MKKGAELKKESVEAAFKGSKYQVTSFDKQEQKKSKTFVASISGMT